MTANRFGRLFSVTTFGESHGPALGAVIDGCPAGVAFDHDLLLSQLARRRPGQSAVVSDRKEGDQPEILSGVFQGRTLGTPIAMIVRNLDARSQDYDNLPVRPGHADDVWSEKFGHVDPRGGGRSSGRETVARVMAGAVAEMFVRALYSQFEVVAYVIQIGDRQISQDQLSALRRNANRSNVDQNPVRCPDADLALQLEEKLQQAKTQGQSFGGVAEVVIRGLPMGLGQPVFHKLKSDLASAMMSVGATLGVEFGDGFRAAFEEGTAYHTMKQTGYGGIRGGISTGEPIVLRVAFKPTSSVLDVAKKGRHDPCIVPRAVVVLEAMAALVIADHVLWQRLDQSSL